MSVEAKGSGHVGLNFQDVLSIYASGLHFRDFRV